MIQSIIGSQAGPRRNFPAWESLFPLVWEAHFPPWSGVWPCHQAGLCCRLQGEVGQGLLPRALGAATGSVMLQGKAMARYGGNSQDESAGSDLNGETKPIVSYSSIAVLECGSLGRASALLLFLGFVLLLPVCGVNKTLSFCTLLAFS